ncbi:hypothetical protein GCM10027405_02540 [Arthrobacter alkaliphilus]
MMVGIAQGAWAGGNADGERVQVPGVKVRRHGLASSSSTADVYRVFFDPDAGKPACAPGSDTAARRH